MCVCVKEDVCVCVSVLASAVLVLHLQQAEELSVVLISFPLRNQAVQLVYQLCLHLVHTHTHTHTHMHTHTKGSLLENRFQVNYD